jgi:3-hydroxyacyl-[acyl-carrier-protein] dehydratase
MSSAAARKLLESLPHRSPFRFVDDVHSVEAQAATGVWHVRGDEPFLGGHFPGRPIVPGVLIAEALAQLSGVVIGRRNEEAQRQSPQHGALAMVDVRFSIPVEPPAAIDLVTELERDIDDLYLFAVMAAVDGQCVARGRLALKAGLTPESA